MIEFRVVHRVQANRRVVDLQLQQEPHLLLADAARIGALALVARRQPVTQPATGAPHDRHVVGPETDFLMQFPVKRFFRGFPEVDPALRELPSAVAKTPRPQHLTVVARDYHAHVRAETLRVYGFGYPFHGAFYPRIHYLAVYDIGGAGPARCAGTAA